MTRTGIVCAFLLTVTSVTFGQTNTDSAAVTRLGEQFHRALAEGDSASAIAILKPDVQILESGGTETLFEYRGHHLPADIAFARAVKSERVIEQVRVVGDVAWIVAKSTSQGTYNDRPVNTIGAELMVLTRSSGTWRISAIHWSSRRRSN
jgi:hypothetical protein